MKRIFAFVLLAFGFASAHAVPTTWSESLDYGSGQYIGKGKSFTYTHDLTTDGFLPSIDTIYDFYLSIDLADDERYDSFEWAFIDLPGLLGDATVVSFDLSEDFGGGVSLLGLLELNSFGTLTVTIQSINLLGIGGDFNLVSSTLTAVGDGKSANVPEPGALGLLGIGLVGIALSKRRRKQVA